MFAEEVVGEVADTRLSINVKWNEWNWCCNKYVIAEEERDALVIGKPPLAKRKLKPTPQISSHKSNTSTKSPRQNLPTPSKAEQGMHSDYNTPGGVGPSPLRRLPKHISPSDEDFKKTALYGENDSSDMKRRLKRKENKRSLLISPLRHSVGDGDATLDHVKKIKRSRSDTSETYLDTPHATNSATSSHMAISDPLSIDLKLAPGMTLL
jgi:hypothetical protein